SGIDVMVTSKLSWGESNIMPNDLFKWRGIDGSETLTYFLTTQEFPMHKDLVNYTIYSGQIKPSHVKGCYNRFRNKEIYKKTLMPFGYGDGGGGTNRLHLELAKRMKKVLPEMPELKLGRADKYFRELRETLDWKKLPAWEGELYLELHRGTFTSQADIKKSNRTQEFLLQNAELLGVIGENLTRTPYPKKVLKENWKKLLTNQFHDLLSGTCIEQANVTAKKDYADIYCEVAPLYYDRMEEIVVQVKGEGNVVFNPNPFTVDATVFMGEEYRFVKNIPPNGYAVREMEPLNNSVEINERTVENNYFILTFNETGDIERLYDKRRKRELIKEGRKFDLSVYEDKPIDYDAWDIKQYAYEKPYPIRFESLTPFKNGCVSGFEIRKTVGASIIVQKIYLFENQPMVEFETYLNWKESNKVLKANFPFDINAQKVINEIPFGYIQRDLHDNTAWEQARFEVCMHKYLDLSESDYGIAILNDCKYGYGIVNREINLTLLKSATYPDPTADKGEHIFRYAIYAHDTGFDTSDVQKQAYLYNNPLYVSTPPRDRQKVFAEEFSLVKSDSEHIVIDTVKKAENGDGYIVRMYETKNTRTDFSLRFGIPLNVAYLCDLQENELEKVPVDIRTVRLTAKPFEILTLKIKK
ncbi:MAG: alpha-mannosidase, partial [Clostridia bacterium]|nr:alpha-mannosidase [Clostridia bacterium]